MIILINLTLFLKSWPNDCKKSGCSNGVCSCFRGGKECTKLCTCLNCLNDQAGGVSTVSDMEDSDDEESDDGTDDDTEKDDEEEFVQLTDEDCPNIEFYSDDALGHDYISLGDDVENSVC